MRSNTTLGSKRRASACGAAKKLFSDAVATVIPLRDMRRTAPFVASITCSAVTAIVVSGGYSPAAER
jgi:hypothetical protein